MFANNTVSTTRFLVLNQPLPGQEENSNQHKKQRIYRALKAPHWVVENEEVDVEEDPTFVDRFRGSADWDGEEEDVMVERTEAGAAYEATLRGATEERLEEPEILAEGKDRDGSPIAEVIEEPMEFDVTKLATLEVPEPEIDAVPSDIDEPIGRRALKKTQLKEEAVKVVDAPRQKIEPESSSASEESESEYESDYDMPSRPRRMKPLFLGKKERKKMASRSRPEEEKTLIATYEKSLKVRRREEARRSLIEIIRAEDAIRRHESDDEELPNTDDEDEDEQFEAWKLRELKRIKREKDALDKLEQERLDLIKRRQMSNKEIERDNEIHGVDRSRREPKKKMKFMQKYYHKGVFYQDDKLVSQKIMKRNYLAPTKEDKWLNFETLPKIMQVKNWGMASRSKYTHLVDQDTTVQGSGDFNEIKSRRPEQARVDALPDYDEDVWRDAIRSTRRRSAPQTAALDRLSHGTRKRRSRSRGR